MKIVDTAYKRSYPYIYRGIVENNIDPENLGRCKVRVPFINGELTYSPDILPWARPIVTSPVSKGRGSSNLPDVGDVVWVFFEGADKKFPVYIGGTYARGELPINTNEVIFYMENDTTISYDREHHRYIIKVGKNKLSISEDSISIDGNLEISGNLSVAGTLIVSDIMISGSCNKEGVHE